MPPPSTENDLKSRARRRLIGAVALTLLAVIVLPLLLEDEPPPASSLAVKMAASTAAEAHDVAAPSGTIEPLDAPIVADATRIAPPQAEATVPEPTQPAPATPAPSPEPPKAAPPKPEPSKPTSKPTTKQAAKQAAKPAEIRPPETKPAAASGAFVVQLAAFSDAAKANALSARAAQAGLPAYTDKSGALTRVRVGPFTSRQAAVDAAVKLAEKGMSGQVLAK
jgi:DedD protein